MENLIKVILITKKARLEEMEGYVLNTTLQLECRFLRAEIAALENELKKERDYQLKIAKTYNKLKLK